MSEETQRHLKPVGTRPEILYGSCKVHKKFADGCLPFRSILSAFQTPTKQTCKISSTYFRAINYHQIHSQRLFPTKFVDQHSSNFMSSLDYHSFFTDISLEETIEMYSNELFKNTDSHYRN